MKNVKVIKLKNLYTNDVVLCENYDKVEKEDGINFVEVFEESKPERKFWVNRDSFAILKV